MDTPEITPEDTLIWVSQETLERIAKYERYIARPKVEWHVAYNEEGQLVPNLDKYTQEEISEYGVDKVPNYLNFISLINSVDNGELISEQSILVSQHTPQLLQDIGLSNYPISHTQSHFKHEVVEENRGHNNHGIPMYVFYQLPEAIEDPYAVIKSPVTSTNPQSIILFLALTDEDGFPLIAPLAPNRTARFERFSLDIVNVHQLQSVYAKTRGRYENKRSRTLGYLESVINDSPDSLLYFNPEKIERFATSEGLQLPDFCANLEYILVENAFEASEISEKVEEFEIVEELESDLSEENVDTEEDIDNELVVVKQSDKKLIDISDVDPNLICKTIADYDAMTTASITCLPVQKPDSTKIQDGTGGQKH